MTQKISRIGVFTSGGDAPGMNAAIRSVVRSAKYYKLAVSGISHGYDGMINNKIKDLNKASVANIIQRGGTVLKTARSMEFKTKEGRKTAYKNLQSHGIDALVAIGGDGTYTGAEVFGREYNIPIIGVPGTIDNDIYGTDYTIGFDTAINTAIDAVDKIRDTADSHNRIFFIEVMGRHSGYIALHTAIGSGAGDVLLPETDTSIDDLVNKLGKEGRRAKLFNLVIVAEGNQNGDAHDIAAAVANKLTDFDIKVTVIGHLQRGGSPTCHDRLLGSRLGFAAVDGLLNNHKAVAAGVVNGVITYTPLMDAINKKKVPKIDQIQLATILAS